MARSIESRAPVCLLGLLVFTLTPLARAYDCSGVRPFVPVAYQSVTVAIARFHWETLENGSRKEVVEDVCATNHPVVLPVIDIREREEEWFHCYQNVSALSCATPYQGSRASVVVKPAMVIRRWRGGVALDRHFHTYVAPANDPGRYFDLFARNLSPDLSRQKMTLDAAGGERGETSMVDSFYVIVEFD